MITHVSLLIASFLLTVPLGAQVVSAGLDIQSNAIVQLERAFDGTIWGITSSAMDLLPTVAGVYVIRSEDEAVTWDTFCVTPNWWRWGADICPLSAKEAWATVLRDEIEDTLEVFRTSDGGKVWVRVTPSEVQLERISIVHFFSSEVGVIVGSVGRKIEHKWAISRTTDGGKTWIATMTATAFGQEQVAERNHRSTARNGNAFWLGMSSGRVLHTQDAGVTWSFNSSPLGGSINAIAMLSNGLILAVRTKSDGNVLGMTTRDGVTWDKAVLPAAVTNVHGLYPRKDGTLIMIPSSISATPMVAISADLASAYVLEGSSLFGVIELKDGSLLAGTEAVKGKGLFRVSR